MSKGFRESEVVSLFLAISHFIHVVKCSAPTDLYNPHQQLLLLSNNIVVYALFNAADYDSAVVATSTLDKIFDAILYGLTNESQGYNDISIIIDASKQNYRMLVDLNQRINPSIILLRLHVIRRYADIICKWDSFSASYPVSIWVRIIERLQVLSENNVYATWLKEKRIIIDKNSDENGDFWHELTRGLFEILT